MLVGEILFKRLKKGTGISLEDSDLDEAFEQIIEKWEAAEQEFQTDYKNKAKKLEKDKETAEEMRKMSMETSGTFKKRKVDPNESPAKRRRDGSDIV